MIVCTVIYIMRIINELAVGRNKCGECCSKQLILLDTHLAAKIPVVASGCCFVWKRSDSCRILAPEFISELCMQHCTGAEVRIRMRHECTILCVGVHNYVLCIYVRGRSLWGHGRGGKIAAVCVALADPTGHV